MTIRMITKIFLLAGFTVFVSLSAISIAGQSARDGTTADDMKKEVKEAVQAIKKYSSEQRDQAVKDVRTALENLDARIDRMQNRMENQWNEMDQASRKKFNETLLALRTKRNELSEWYGGMKHGSADAWEHVKSGFVESYEALANAFDKAESEFNAGGSSGDPS